MDRSYVMALLEEEHKNTDERLIKRGDLIDWDLYIFLKHAKIKNREMAFFDTTQNAHIPYKVELKCELCGKSRIVDLTISKLRKSFNVHNICEECGKKLEEERKNKQQKLKQKEKDFTEVFIDHYFSPKEMVDTTNYYDVFKDGMRVNDTKIQEVVAMLPYKAFLDSAYWDCIRRYKLKKAKYRCPLCGSRKHLNVHHITYSTHGLEHNRKVADEDLIVLCNDCHKKVHDIPSKEIEQ